MDKIVVGANGMGSWVMDFKCQVMGNGLQVEQFTG